MITSRKPKIPKLRSAKLKSSPSLPWMLMLSSVFGMNLRSMYVSRTAPSTEPQMLPRPPRMIIASTKIENENWNWFALIEFV